MAPGKGCMCLSISSPYALDSSPAVLMSLKPSFDRVISTTFHLASARLSRPLLCLSRSLQYQSFTSPMAAINFSICRPSYLEAKSALTLYQHCSTLALIDSIVSSRSKRTP
jgi:hypothetical protein